MRTRQAVEWADEASSRGAGEVLLTSIDRDGTRSGFDCELTAAVSEAVSIPVIASGGAGDVRSLRRRLYPRTRRRRARRVRLPLLPRRASRRLRRHLPPRRFRCVSTPPRAGADSGADAHALLMFIPAIDLQGGRIVQLVQGERARARRPDDVDAWVNRFAKRPEGAADRSRRGEGSSGDNERLVRAHLRSVAVPRRRRHPHRRARRERAARSAPRR